MSQESMDYDVVIVGAGPAGLSAAIHIKQLCQHTETPLSVCVLEKGATVGAHILSGAVFEPRALNELLPDWQERNAPLLTPVTRDRFLYLTERHALRLPTPKPMHNKGNYVISLGRLCQWLAEQAEALGVEIYPGFAGAKVFYDDANRVIGVATGDMGIAKDGSHTTHYQPGMALYGKQVIFAEGCRGFLSEQVMKQFNLRQQCDPQTYGIGIKELWEVSPEQHHAGEVVHTIGWPLDQQTYGGSFIYHLDNNHLAVGFVIGLDYQNPHLDPFKEMQRFKTHPHIKPLFQQAKRIAYGARALNEGGWQSLPLLSFPGGVIVGDAAGFLNVPKIKGSHTAMKSGMLAAKSIVDYLQGKNNEVNYPDAVKSSWIAEELKQVRNIRPSFRWGLWPAMAYSAIDTYLFRGKTPWTLKNHADHTQLRPAATAKKIIYPKPDGTITFDRLSSVYLSNTHHAENQPCHLLLRDPTIPINKNLPFYDAPEQRYCPAGVYEIVYTKDKDAELVINAQNCVHCKTCDIKDPTQNIVWVTPEGGGGPNYSNM